MSYNLNHKNKRVLTMQDLKTIERYSSKTSYEHIDEVNLKIAASIWNEYEIIPEYNNAKDN